MTRDSLNSVHEAILEALKIVSDAKRSAETARDEAQRLRWMARRADPGMDPVIYAAAVNMAANAATRAAEVASGFAKLESLAASVARLQTDAEKPLLTDANSEWGPWTEWRSDECPVPAGTWTEVRFRIGDTADGRSPETWRWGDGEGGYIITAYRVRQSVAAPPASSEAVRVELAEALNRAEAAERDLEDVRKERDMALRAYDYLATTAERDHNRVAELFAEIKHLRAERDSASAALRGGLDPFAVVLATEGPAAYADRWRALATSLWADRLKGHADGRKDPDVL